MTTDNAEQETSLETTPPDPQVKRTFEDISSKRVEERKENYKKIKDFFDSVGRLPATKTKDSAERYLAQFFINRKSAKKNKKTDEWENKTITELEDLHKNSKDVFKRSKLCKLLCILEFSQNNKRIPSQTAEDALEKDLGVKFNSIKIKQNKLNAEEKYVFDEILKFKSRYMLSRKEKLVEAYNFCLDNEHTPRQHVKDEVEKKMADFLSSTKSYLIDNTMPEDEMEIYNKILYYKRPDKKQKLQMLLDFSIKNKKVPGITSENEKERTLAIFLTKLKHLQKTNKIDKESDNILKEIFKICDLRSRLDKIRDLHQYIAKNDFPSIGSTSDQERKYAIFFSNVKRLMHLGKLNKDELDLFSKILQKKESVNA